MSTDDYIKNLTKGFWLDNNTLATLVSAKSSEEAAAVAAVFFPTGVRHKIILRESCAYNTDLHYDGKVDVRE